MGADGGVCWFKLKKPEKYQRLLDLLEPLNIRTHHSIINCCASFVQDKHDEDEEVKENA